MMLIDTISFFPPYCISNTTVRTDAQGTDYTCYKLCGSPASSSAFGTAHIFRCRYSKNIWPDKYWRDRNYPSSSLSPSIYRAAASALAEAQTIMRVSFLRARSQPLM